MAEIALVVGANEFLGSHLTKLLVNEEREVRTFTLRTSDNRIIDQLNVEQHYGDILNKKSLIKAMKDCTSVFYCLTDIHSRLVDTKQMYHRSIAGLYNMMDTAIEANVTKFILISNFETIRVNNNGLANDLDVFNWWGSCAHHIRCDITAEKRLLEYCQDRQFPGIVCCVGNTYGKEDYKPSVHRQFLLKCAKGKMPFYWKGGAPSLGITDAANAILQAEKKGHIGQRYTICDRWMSYRELFTLGNKAAGTKPPRIYIPLALMYIAAGISFIGSKLYGNETLLGVSSIRCSTMKTEIDTNRAKTELEWQPRPVEESINEAVEFYDTTNVTTSSGNFSNTVK